MEAERERYREGQAAVLESGTRNNVQIEREGVEERTFADEVPVLYGLKVDWEDRIWLQRRGPTGENDGPTDIVTPDGDYIGTLPPDGLRTPDAFGLAGSWPTSSTTTWTCRPCVWSGWLRWNREGRARTKRLGRGVA